MEKKALVRIGERRHDRYDLAMGLRPVKPVQIDQDGNLNLASDPFFAGAAWRPGIYTRNMSGPKRDTTADVVALLNRYQCPTPFHAVRARFMGSIVSPAPDRLPVHAIQELWGGNFPPFDSVEDLNHLLHVLADGLWNRLTAHQAASNPFKLTRVPARQTREGVRHYALVRKQEIEGFMDGLFGPHDELDMPESARDGMDALGEIRAMLAGAIDLLDDAGKPAPPDQLKGLADNLQALATIVEKEVNSVIGSCTRARRQLLAGTRSKPTVH